MPFRARIYLLLISKMLEGQMKGGLSRSLVRFGGFANFIRLQTYGFSIHSRLVVRHVQENAFCWRANLISMQQACACALISLGYTLEKQCLFKKGWTNLEITLEFQPKIS